MIPTPFLEACFATCLLLAHPGVDNHINTLDSVGEDGSVYVYGTIEKLDTPLEFLSYCIELERRHEPTLDILLQNSFRSITTYDLRFYRDAHHRTIGAPYIEFFINRRLGPDNVDNEYRLICYQTAFIESHIEHLEGLALLNPSFSHRYQHAAEAWRDRLTIWKAWRRALDTGYNLADRRAALLEIRTRVGDDRFWSHDWPPLLLFFPDPYRDR